MVLVGGFDMDFESFPSITVGSLKTITQFLDESMLKVNTIENISSDVKKFTFRFDGDSSYNVFINHSEHVPSDMFIWDYFGTGELYLNFQTCNITSWKDSFPKLFTGYLLTGKLTVPQQPGLTPFHFATSMFFIDRNVWAFPIATFFHYEKIQKESPICSYFSLTNSNVSIVSKHWQFANTVDSAPCCSHPTLSSSTKHSYCSFYPGNSACPLYTPSFKVIHSNVISLDNTSNEIVFDIHYSLTDSSSHIFQIVNTTEDVIVNTFKYSSDMSYDDLFVEVIDIFNTYLSSYLESNCVISNKEVSFQDTDKDTPKVSYIESLIGV